MRSTFAHALRFPVVKLSNEILIPNVTIGTKWWTKMCTKFVRTVVDKIVDKSVH